MGRAFSLGYVLLGEPICCCCKRETNKEKHVSGSLGKMYAPPKKMRKTRQTLLVGPSTTNHEPSGWQQIESANNRNQQQYRFRRFPSKTAGQNTHTHKLTHKHTCIRKNGEGNVSCPMKKVSKLDPFRSADSRTPPKCSFWFSAQWS